MYFQIYDTACVDSLFFASKQVEFQTQVYRRVDDYENEKRQSCQLLAIIALFSRHSVVTSSVIKTRLTFTSIPVGFAKHSKPRGNVFIFESLWTINGKNPMDFNARLKHFPSPFSRTLARNSANVHNKANNDVTNAAFFARFSFRRLRRSICYSLQRKGLFNASHEPKTNHLRRRYRVFVLVLNH